MRKSLPSRSWTENGFESDCLEGPAEIGSEDIFQSESWLDPFGLDAEDLFTSGKMSRLIAIGSVAMTATRSEPCARFPLGAVARRQPPPMPCRAGRRYNRHR